jgi:hypothetical protein
LAFSRSSGLYRLSARTERQGAEYQADEDDEFIYSHANKATSEESVVRMYSCLPVTG